MSTPHQSLQNRGLHRYAIMLAVCTLLLVVAGASVTSKEAGLSVPDWPLSYGKVMPPMTGGVFFEHGHRMIATTVGLLTIGLLIWVWRADSRRWMRTLSLAALGAVILQGVLGGLTVLLLLPPMVSVSHACLAQLFFSTTVCIAVFTSRSWHASPEIVEDHGWPSLRSIAVVVPVLVLGQIALGAAFRHKALGLLPHLAGAMVVVGALLIIGAFVLNQFPEHRTLRPAAIAMQSVAGVQIFLGLLAYYVRMQPDVNPNLMFLSTVAHVATGALTLASTVVVSAQILRCVRPAGEIPNTQAVAS